MGIRKTGVQPRMALYSSRITHYLYLCYFLVLILNLDLEILKHTHLREQYNKIIMKPYYLKHLHHCIPTYGVLIYFEERLITCPSIRLSHFIKTCILWIVIISIIIFNLYFNFIFLYFYAFGHFKRRIYIRINL